MIYSTGVITAYLLDLAIGDPRWIPHPVRGMGKLISFLEGRLNRGESRTILRFKGILLAGTVICLTFFSGLAVLEFSRAIAPGLEWVSSVVLSFFCLSTRDLYDHGMRILRKLERKEIEGARSALSFIVTRQTGHMGEEEIVRSAVESIGENTTDGVCAPLFYLLLGGPLFSLVYKAVNTLDSMVGYRNERYVHFGWFSARLDDVMNFIPARISGFLIAISAMLYYRSFSAFILSLRTLVRDSKKHPSPNSGCPEAAMAGAIGIKVSGPAIYEGKLYFKPFIGTDRRRVTPRLIEEALHISILSSLMMLMGGMAIHGF